ncbi:DUF4489 domain-containing protein [Clostridium bowmanii]|uniref:DUF4489 domain-containing protein n=1 Tax=Clostridium bowmanii TaxID=132925 RepID=UPI001C0BF52F|nr:DUF4489 domain-containing protein [Clostridium bowmanii]MBU3191293.1 DUF4489 domain-containing protein [Clostridium bowmanii]MCA1075742.1 DUF4489 domain-containing protein [Clostridium bowmanii]
MNSKKGKYRSTSYTCLPIDNFSESDCASNSSKIILKSGNPLSSRIKPPLVLGAAGAPITVAIVTVNTSCLCDPKIKLDFTLNIAIPEGFSTTNITFQVFRMCNHDTHKTPVGPQWSYINRLSGGSTELFTFFVYDSDICDCDIYECKRCTYTVDATLTA